MEASAGTICSACNTSVPSSSHFCLNCGTPLKKKPIPTSCSRQIIIYMISFFLAPFGLWYAWKYIKQGDGKAKRIGIASIAITVTSLALSLWTTVELINSLGPLLKSLLQI